MTRLLTGLEVAERLGVSTKTVLRWALAGQLPSVRLSTRAIRFPEDQLDAWLKERATPARERVTDPETTRRPAGILGRVTDPREPSWPEH